MQSSRSLRRVHRARLARIIGAMFLAAADLQAQTLPAAGTRWAPYHAPDSSFAVIMPAKGVQVAQNAGIPPFKQSIYVSNVGFTTFIVSETEADERGLGQLISQFNTPCKGCGGLVIVRDSSLRVGKLAGHWLRREGAYPDRPGLVVEEQREFLVGNRLFAVSATSSPGEPLSADANRFIESLTICEASRPCDPPNATPGVLASEIAVTVMSPAQGSGAVDPAPAARAPRPAPAVNPANTFFAFQVEKEVTIAAGNVTPHFPDSLRIARVSGEVLASFIVDTTGLADVESFKVLKSTHDLYSAAVRDALPAMRFTPAEIGGRKVRQLVQQPFVFFLPP